MMKTLAEWIKFYNKKVAEPFQRNERFSLYFSPEKGFCEITATDKMVLVYQCAGDLRFWRHAAEKLAKLLNLRMLGTMVYRHIKPYLRLSGFSIERTEQKPNEEPRYHCRDLKTGQAGLATPNGNYCDEDTPVYICTWSLDNEYKI